MSNYIHSERSLFPGIAAIVSFTLYPLICVISDLHTWLWIIMICERRKKICHLFPSVERSKVMNENKLSSCDGSLFHHQKRSTLFWLPTANCTKTVNIEAGKSFVWAPEWDGKIQLTWTATTEPCSPFIQWYRSSNLKRAVWKRFQFDESWKAISLTLIGFHFLLKAFT